MLDASDDFTQQMQADVRKVVYKLYYVQENEGDQAILSSINVSGDTAPPAIISQVVAGVNGYDEAYATFEPHAWPLDGSCGFIPDNAEDRKHMGYWSPELSDAEGIVECALTISNYDFTRIPVSKGISIIFDDLRNQYATDFDVRYFWYHSSGSYYDASIPIRDNTSPIVYISPIVGHVECLRIDIIIYRWSQPLTYAKVSSVVSGRVIKWDGDELTDSGLTITQEVSPTCDTVSSNQLTFALSAIDGKYNIRDPEGIYTGITSAQRIKVYMGAGMHKYVEYVPSGTYYLTDWGGSSNNTEVNITAQDYISLLEGNYLTSIYQTQTLYDMALDVLNQAAIPPTMYNIDSSLSDIIVNAYIPVTTIREALHTIALAGRCVCYVDVHGIIQIKRINHSLGNEYLITLDNQYSYPNIQKQKPVHGLILPVHTYTPSESTSELFRGIVGSVSAYMGDSFWVPYKKPATNVTVDIATIHGSYKTAIAYTNGVHIILSPYNPIFYGNVVVTGYELTDYQSEFKCYLSSDGTSINVDNPLITSTESANNVGTWLLNTLNKPYIYNCDWRQDPAIQCTDYVSVEDSFGTQANILVTSQTLKYNGALSGNTGGVA